MKTVELKPITNPKVGQRVFHRDYGIGIIEWKSKWNCEIQFEGIYKNITKEHLFDATNITEDTEEVIIRFKI